MIGFNLNDVSSINFGSIGIDSVYVGNTKIWEDTPPHDYEQDYFTTVAKGNGTIKVEISSGLSTSYMTSISYSTDGGNTWTTTNNEDNQTINITVNVNEGDKILWKGDAKTFAYDYNTTRFRSTINFDVEGNIMSLLNGDNFYHSSFASNTNYNFKYLFRGNNCKLVDASNLILPAATLTMYCYNFMFAENPLLISAPTSLPATTLAMYCYDSMFYDCSALVNVPSLPTTTLATNCYNNMFRNCTSLTTAPTLPATTLTNGCYSSMFRGCSNLNNITMLATNISAPDCLYDWVNGVSATGTFTKDANATIPEGTSGIPIGWTVINQAAPYNLLDILYSDANGNLSVDSNVLPASEGKTPIGLCVAPTEFFGANEPARWMSLKYMSCDRPENGSINEQTMMMGQYGVDISGITNIQETYVNGSDWGYLTADWISGTDEKIPSLFDANDNWNIAQLGTVNAFAVTDIDGKAKTAKWLEAATAQPNWQTDSTITNNGDTGYSPAACCCARYHTLGTSAGDWYLGAAGEISMIIVLKPEINAKLQQISAVYPTNCIYGTLAGGTYWTSTEYSRNLLFGIQTNGGSVDTANKNINCRVLAMLNY